MKRLIICLVIIFAGLGIGIYIKKSLNKKPALVVKIINNLDGGGIAGTIRAILNERYDVKINDTDFDIIIDNPYGDVNRDYSALEERDPKVIKMFYTAEAILPNLNNYDLVIGFDHVEDPRYIRFPWYYMYPFGKKIRADYNKEADLGGCNPKKPYFACFLVSNDLTDNWRNHMPLDGCSARISIFNKLSQYKRVESGGKVLNNIGRVIEVNETMEWLAQCKFVIAYENQTYDGYITEKPFQAYFAGSIPIYYGAQTAVQDMNKKAIIYAKDFQSEDDLIDRIKTIDNDDELYCDTWKQNIINNSEQNFEVVKDKLRKKLFEVIESKLHK